MIRAGAERESRPVESHHAIEPLPTVLITLDDERGLRAAYRAHGPELLGFSRRALGDPELAEGAVRETFARAWRAGERFDPARGSLRAWLFAILRTVIVDLVRDHARRPLPDPVAGSPDPYEEQIDRALDGWRVEEALRRIGPEHRRVLIETYYRGRPYGEVAVDLGVPVETVKVRIHHGLRALRLALEDVGWRDDD